MPWYYVENGEQRGPVADTDFDALFQAGKVTDDTLVWREGLASWQPWRDAKPRPAGMPSAGAAPASGLVCAECGKIFQPDQVIRLNDRWVCATCKPIHLQRIREGTFAGSGARAGLVTEAQVRERDYEHDVGGYASQAWQMFKNDAGSILGVMLVVGLCIIVANMIPYLGTITGIVFTGPLLGGMYIFFLKKIRGEGAAMGDAFSGFGPRFGQLLLGKFIPNLLAGLVLIPLAIVVVIFLVMGSMGGKHEGLSALTTGVPLVIGGVLALAAICVMIYLQYCWVFTLWLVADKNMTFWPAMSLSRAVVMKHWWQTFLLGIVSGLLMLLGLVLCLVGILATGPVALGMWAYAYERLFGDMQPAAD